MADNKSKRYTDAQSSSSTDTWSTEKGQGSTFGEPTEANEQSGSSSMGSSSGSNQELRHTVADTGQRIKESAVDAGQRVKETAVSVANETQQTLGAVAQDAKEKAESVVSQQKEMVAERVSTFASTLRETGRQLQQENEGTIGEYAQSFAGQLDRFAGYLQRSDMNDLIGEVRTLARRQPEIFLAGSLAVGFLVGRFLKSSAGSAGPNYAGSTYRGSAYRSSGYLSDAREASWRGDYAPQRYESQRYESQGYGRPYSGGQGSSYPDLMYRDPMRGDAPIREEMYTGNPTYSETQAGGISSNRTDAGTQGLVANADTTQESGGSGYDDTSASGAMDSSRTSTRGSDAT